LYKEGLSEQGEGRRRKMIVVHLIEAMTNKKKGSGSGRQKVRRKTVVKRETDELGLTQAKTWVGKAHI